MNKASVVAVFPQGAVAYPYCYSTGSVCAAFRRRSRPRKPCEPHKQSLPFKSMLDIPPAADVIFISGALWMYCLVYQLFHCQTAHWKQLALCR